MTGPHLCHLRFPSTSCPSGTSAAWSLELCTTPDPLGNLPFSRSLARSLPVSAGSAALCVRGQGTTERGARDALMASGCLRASSLLLRHEDCIPRATRPPWRVPESAAAAVAKSLQSCPTLCNPIDSSPPGSPVPGILQVRTLEWIAISFSNA